MLCGKCGKKGFPVRIACVVCNATLPDVPATFETPAERSKPKKVQCSQCGSVALDARIACQRCDASFPRPFRLSEADGAWEDSTDIAYYTFMCSHESCDQCKKWDGVCFLPSKRREYHVPISTCQNPVCWCDIVGVCGDEGTLTLSGSGGQSDRYALPGSGEDIAEFLKRSDGAATAEQISAYIDAQSAAERERNAREAAGVDLFARAFDAENVSRDLAIALYRESVAAWKIALREDPNCRWDYLEDSYNRLTLALERSKRFPEAIAVIDDYKAFRALMQRNQEVETISKREKRLKKRITGGGSNLSVQ